MNEETKTRCELRAHMFKALAHPVRLYILEKLRERPMFVCEMADELRIDKSTASKHISQLRDAGIVEVVKKGTSAECFLAAPCVLELASCAENAVLRNRKKKLGL